MYSEISRKCRKFCENTHKNVRILIDLNIQKGFLTRIGTKLQNGALWKGTVYIFGQEDLSTL